MSEAVPGSCFPNWLQGTPTMANPWLPNFSCSASSGLYCGVLPHLLATFTSSTTFPLYFSAKFTFLPSSVSISTFSGDSVVAFESFDFGEFFAVADELITRTPDATRHAIRKLFMANLQLGTKRAPADPWSRL